MSRSLLTRLKKPNLIKRIWKKLISLFFVEQWVIFISQTANRAKPNWQDFTPLLPPPDRDWADPFLWQHEGRYYIFIEEKPFTQKHAHIACLSLDENLNITAKTVVLQRPYHLSYPFLFKYQDQLYMMPETLGNHAIEVYRCVRFPDQWEFHKTLLPNLNAVDATLIEKDDTWWLFANIQDENASTWTTLCLYTADSPLADNWTPHPQNPIVKDVASARPAGNILRQGSTLIRPSQDCSVRYGYATNFIRINTLSKTEYRETIEHTFKPPAFQQLLAVHTWNELNDLTVIDATLRRRKRG